MDQNIKISFIIPVYNAEKTLKETVSSILRQNNEDIEIILVNDGSKDSSKQICDGLKRRYPVVKAIHQKNQGSLAARMVGADEAKGQYLMFVDADDIILEGAVEHIIQDVNSRADLYIYDYIMEAVGGHNAKTIRLMKDSNMCNFNSENKVEISRVFMDGMMNTVCATGISRSCYERIRNIKFPERIKNGEDRLQKMHLLLAAETIVYVPYAFYYYKWVNGSQGDNLRQGLFSRKIYEDFVAVWSEERLNYKKMGFSPSESIKYDYNKLNRVCSLLERYFIESEDLKPVITLMKMIAEDKMFCEISEKSIRKSGRRHIRISALLLRNQYICLLLLYWRICSCIRKVVHK